MGSAMQGALKSILTPNETRHLGQLYNTVHCAMCTGILV